MKVTLNIPNNLKEIKLSQYQKWYKIAKDSEDSFFLQQKMVEIFCNIPLKVVNVMKATDVTDCFESMNNLFTGKVPHKTITKVNGVDYGFIPNLDDISFGEYVDLDTYMSDWDTMDKAMAVLYRPCSYINRKTYTIESYESAEKYKMGDISLDVVFGAIVFFYRLRNELQKTILSYLDKQKVVEMPPQWEDFMQNGDGINPSMDSLMGISLNTMKLPKSMYTPV